ncbi:MAG TPA: ribulose-bisphosphate carboxylase [Candidatus Dojkabacteria bacterium]|nr:ribulose-bisphosphate carboxylase [Candidatus Dojkabacteria bacterium]
MQEQYLGLGDTSVHNGQYMLTVFKLVPHGDESIESAATELAAESSSGSNLKVSTATNYSMNLDAIVYDIDKERNLVYIAYPWLMFDRGGNVQNILTFIAGNIFGMSNLKECKLLDVWFPPQMLVQYDGPSYTLDDMRKYLGVFDRPILGTIIKPKIGLTSTEYAELCYDFWVGGGDFVKNDEPQADQQFAPYEKMVDSVRMAMDKAELETGKRKIHSFNVSAADFDTMIRRADYVRRVMKPGSYAFLIDGITAGWTSVQTLRRHYPDVFIHFHRAGHGAFTRKENPIGFSVPVLTKFARLAGASGIHTGTAGVGKMAGDAAEDIGAAKQALKLQAKGEFFNQVWAEIPERDPDMQEMMKREELFWGMPTRDLAAIRRAKHLTMEVNEEHTMWRVIRKTSPIVSGGLNPVLLPDFLDVFGSIDFIVTMGGGVHSHPMGTSAGIKAVFQAYEAWLANIPLEEYAKDKEELRVAMDFYNKHGIQAHR